jgi:hypothetical protein
MNRSKQFRLMGLAMAALAGVLLVGCSGVATREIEAERATLHSEPVSMNAKDLPEANIDATGAVKIGKENLPLTAEQRVLTREYRAAAIKLVDLTLSDTARITDHAMSRVLFASLIGRADEAGEKLGKQAEALVHTPQFCQLLGDMKQSQDRMVQSVTTLQPYANISQQTIENCMAGKPYHVSI